MTGLPRHFTVISIPGSMSPTFTSMEESASTSLEGFIWLISGQTAAAVPTAPNPAVAT